MTSEPTPQPLDEIDEWRSADHYFRVRVLLDIAPALTDRDYWRAVAEAWQDSDRNGASPRIWRDLFSARRPERAALMTAAERAQLAALPDRVEVHRGVNRFNRRFNGLSWTLDREQAEWFARRGIIGPSHVITGRVKRERIIALLQTRQESEVLIFPRYVYARVVVDFGPEE